MSKDRQRRHAAKKEAAVRGDRRVGRDCPVIVVGIGAPAGRVKSLKQLFAKMPPGHGVAFVLIQHLEPPHENLTVKLVKEQTGLAVVEATDGMPVLADRIHVIPPDKFLNITGSRLTLQEPVHCNGLRMPIDHFFCSLALDQRRRGCGILLSGTGSDGNLGLSEIKAAGGTDVRGRPRQRRVTRTCRRARSTPAYGGRGPAGGGHGRGDCSAGGADDGRDPKWRPESRRSSTPTCGPSWRSCARRWGMTSAVTSPTRWCGGFAGG